MNKDLETLFRSTFEAENISDESWNVPSDLVWNEIEKDLTRKKKRRFAFFWSSTFAVLSVAFAMFFLSRKEFFISKSSTEKVVTEKENNKAGEINKSQIFDEKKSQTIDHQEVTNKVLISESEKAKPFISSFGKKSEPSNNSKIDFSTKNINLSSNSINHENTIVPIFEKNENTEQKRVPEKTLLPISQDTKYLVIPELNVNIAHIYVSNLDFSLKKPQNSLNYATIFSAQTFLMKNKIVSNDKVDFSGEKFNLAYTIGVGASKMIGKKTFVTLGLQHSKIEYALNYNVNLPFNQNGEKSNINGNFDNQYSGAIPTSQGEIKMEMILQRQAKQTVTQGEAIPISASGKQELKFLRIPLSIGTSFFNIGKLQIINQLSFNQMINTSSETTFQSVLSHHSAVQETQTVVRFSPKPKKWTPEIGTSIGFYFPITKKVQIGAEGFFNQSLRPMYENSSYSNTPISYGFGGNLKYNF
jgi:hypothetical protein